jgi:hypothetical protein
MDQELIALMHEPKEGVIKFNLVHEETQDPIVRPEYPIQELSFWRNRFHQLKLIGQEPGRYDDAGYGNVSARVPPFTDDPHARQFIITATQTGKDPYLPRNDYTLVKAYLPERNTLISLGPHRPSAESMTHGMIYDEFPWTLFVFHAHSPDIWRKAARLGIPITHPDVPYGTPRMALEVRRLHQEGRLENIFSMGGHEDGIVTFGETADQAGEAMVRVLSRARDT